MGKLIRTTKPLLFESKLLCVSVLYLITTLFLALYSSLSRNKCIFRSSPFDPIQGPLFSYPLSYGEHKYALPTHRSSCSSPVFFSDYWTALKEIQDFTKNTSFPLSEPLRYISGNSDIFGGNFSTQKRISYFNRWNVEVQVPCGFFKEYPVSVSDRAAMEECRGVVVASAIFNDHDKIRQPLGVGSKTMDNVCFFMFIDETTLQGLYHHNVISRDSPQHRVGVWKIVRVLNLYQNPAMNGVIPKYLIHRLFPNSKFSVWIDAKIQLAVDPLLLIHSLLLTRNMDMAISKHPFFTHTMEEAMATARWKKWGDVDALRVQLETYCEHGLEPWSAKKLPHPTDVPDSAVILRRHGGASDMFSCMVFNELEAFNPRDQLAFAFVRDKMNPQLRLNMFEAEVLEQIAVEYRHNLQRFGAAAGGNGERGEGHEERKRVKRTYHGFPLKSSKCREYLMQMWGEFHD